MAEALTHSNCKLNSLNLSSNLGISDEGVKYLAEALTHSNCKLNSLNVSNKKRILRVTEGVKYMDIVLTQSGGVLFWELASAMATVAKTSL